MVTYYDKKIYVVEENYVLPKNYVPVVSLYEKNESFKYLKFKK
jgi:hypothetical protein